VNFSQDFNCFVKKCFAPFALNTTSPPFHGGEGDGKLLGYSNAPQRLDLFYKAHIPAKSRVRRNAHPASTLKTRHLALN
jgi:hypothetical protein